MNLTKQLLEDLYKYDKKQVKKIFRHDNGQNIDGTFIGFMEAYYHLSKVIPTDWTIVDLGCFAGFQSWYFKKHKKYIGIDLTDTPKLNLDNTEYHKMNIEKYVDSIKQYLPKTFVICNYVPLGHTALQNLKEKFNNLYIFYP